LNSALLKVLQRNKQLALFQVKCYSCELLTFKKNMMINKTERIFQFKRVFFEDENKTKFIGASDWGVNVNNCIFESPRTNTGADSFVDVQYLKYKGVIYCEGDILKYRCIHSIEVKYVSISVDNGTFYTSKADRLVDLIHTQTIYADNHNFKSDMPKNVGDVFQNKDLLD